MHRHGEIFTKHNYYHIYNRGINRNLIFFNRENYKYCIRLVRKYAVRYEISVLCYCLMPNHYHLLIRQEGDIQIYRFINVLFNSYVQAVNHQQNRTGPLFGGKYKYVHIAEEPYLTHLCRYIHLNPVMANIVSKPEDWEFSDYQEWINPRKANIERQKFVRSFFDDPQEYATFCRELLPDTKGKAFQFVEKYRLD